MKTLTLGFLLGLVLVFLCNVNCLAQDWNWSGSFDVRSQYIGGMTGSTIITETVVQPSVTLSHNNCYANVWLSTRLINPTHIRKGDELDLSVGYLQNIRAIKNEIALLYYNLYPLSTSRGDLFAVRDTLTIPEIADWNTSLAFEYEIPENKRVLAGGFLYKVESHREILVEEKKIIGSVAIGGHDGAYGLKPEVISFVRGTATFPISMKTVIVSPSFMLQWGAKKGGLADNQAILGLNVSWP